MKYIKESPQYLYQNKSIWLFDVVIQQATRIFDIYFILKAWSGEHKTVEECL